jgi:hypothetical protein
MSSYYGQQQYQQIPQNQVEMQQYNGYNNQHGNSYGNSSNSYGNSSNSYGNNSNSYENNKMTYSQYAKQESSKAYNSANKAYRSANEAYHSAHQYASKTYHSAHQSFKRFNDAFDNNPSLSEKAKVGLKIATALLIIAVIVIALYYFIKFSIKLFKGIAEKTKELLDEATANGLNPIQWMVDPLGSMLNLMGYFWKSFISLITGGWIK